MSYNLFRPSVRKCATKDLIKDHIKEYVIDTIRGIPCAWLGHDIYQPDRNKPYVKCKRCGEFQ